MECITVDNCQSKIVNRQSQRDDTSTNKNVPSVLMVFMVSTIYGKETITNLFPQCKDNKTHIFNMKTHNVSLA